MHHYMHNYAHIFPVFSITVEPLIADTFTAKVRWPLLGGGRYWEVAAIQRFTTNFLTQISKECLFSCLKKGRACDGNPV